MLWIPVTLVAAAAQTARNFLQRGLVARIGTLGATQVRFLFGLPFAILFLLGVVALTGEAPPRPNSGFTGFAALGAVSQIAATALMLLVMKDSGFATVTAYIKTEPVLVALVGFAVLGDALALPAGMAIVVATAGVILISSPRPAADLLSRGWRPALIGVAAGGLFAVAAVSFRGAILSLDHGTQLMRATTTLVAGLTIQTLVLGAWLASRDRAAFVGSLTAWRPSLIAGFLGALASQFWFLGFALTSAANVRTLALVEVLFAVALARRALGQRLSGVEAIGLVLVVGGVGALLLLQA